MTAPAQYILGSRSPRRKELLGLVVPPEQIIVLPPANSGEAGFEGLHELSSIETRLIEIARAKGTDVLQQIRAGALGFAPHPESVLITGDTTIAVLRPESGGSYLSLGQPPEDDTWTSVVRDWFQRYYAGQTHVVLSALLLQTLSGRETIRIVHTSVTFRRDVNRWLDWYLASGEPRGKAGGYAIQGLGSIFVTRVEGSITNVVGLPLEALHGGLEDLHPTTS
jgi:septum formation protein